MKLKNYLTESSLSRVLTHIEKTKNFGVISPFRKENSDKKNEEDFKELSSLVRKMGYGYIVLRGGYNGDEGFFAEKSLFIPNIKRNQIIELGIRYNQHSIIFKDENSFSLIGTNSSSGVGQTLDNFVFGKGSICIDDVGDKFKDFFSKLAKGSHSNKKFLFRMQEKVETSMYYKMKHGEEWITILEER